MKDYLTQTVTAICESISFDSSLKEAQVGMPFGKGAADCLEHFLSLAQSLGFQTRNYDNYIGEVLFGEGEPFAVLAHLDVVPAGNGWHTPPFEGTVIDGKLYGRGATDDKGPAIAALFAMKSLLDEGFLPKKQIRLIVGCNEECGWQCIEHYKKVATLPETGFSPDAEFPVIYAEKGIWHVTLRFPLGNPPFTSFEGGERVNMVCDLCQATPGTLDEPRAKTLGLEISDNTLISHGKSAHGSTPDEGKNAILPLLRYFDEDEEIKRIISALFEDVHGLKNLRDETGNLTLSPNVVRFERGSLYLTCDVRYPASLPLSLVKEKFATLGVDFQTERHQPPLYHDKESALVRTLCEVYHDFSEQQCEPIAIGGGTYARALKMGVAFGPEVAGEDCAIHQPNEFISLDRIQLLLDVYAAALKRLTK